MRAQTLDRQKWWAIERHPAPTPSAQRAALMKAPKFGAVFTDHMVTMRYAGGAWSNGVVGPRAPLSCDPGMSAFHYGQAVFEGLKAFRLHDGGLALFRPFENAKRFNASAERLAMPTVPEGIFVEALETLVSTDEVWTPVSEGTLYLRPYMIATDAALGVRPSETYLFGVIACPVGSYFPAGKESVAIWVSEQHSRAGRGGTGAAKCAGNYASSLVAQAEAARNGCDQVLFLDADEQRWIEELGGMNVFFGRRDGSLVTPSLTGTILAGVTRQSIIDLARASGRQVEERRYSFDELRADVAQRRVTEAFACGTAASVAPIAEIRFAAGSLKIGEGRPGEASIQLRDQLVGIQRGLEPDPNCWVHRIVS